jgi:hypothetical protein
MADESASGCRAPFPPSPSFLVLRWACVSCLITHSLAPPPLLSSPDEEARQNIFSRFLALAYIPGETGKTYTSLLPLPPSFEPTDDLHVLLEALADRLGTLRKGGERDLDAARGYLIRAFREGKLGRWTLDDLETVESGFVSTSMMDDEWGGDVEVLRDLRDGLGLGVGVGGLTPSSVADLPWANAEPASTTSTTGTGIATEDENGTTTATATSPIPSQMNDLDRLNRLNLDQRVSLAVRSFLDTASASASNALEPEDVSITQQRKAQTRKAAEERTAKLLAKGVEIDGRRHDWRRAAKPPRSGRKGRGRR